VRGQCWLWWRCTGQFVNNLPGAIRDRKGTISQEDPCSVPTRRNHSFGGGFHAELPRRFNLCWDIAPSAGV